MRRLLCLLILPLLLAGCAEHIWASDEAVQKARYHSSEPTSITLFTVVRKRGNEGAHSGLMINGSERVIYDPAGTWTNPAAPERNDLHFGMTPLMVKYYIDYHARTTYDVYEQTVRVSPEVAQLAIQKAEAEGASMKAMCGNSVSAVLKGLPGFENVRSSFFPGRLMREFATLPGVVTMHYTDSDDDNNKGLLATQVAAPGQ
ncbi:MAG: hypothetical protein JSR87_06785 [Proteobacteria bacterium]|nr:hypothetical protein [Pseudomonadota bacterium]MBS0572716.1 hypothetical protein [Pseudomonadota bacterium]